MENLELTIKHDLNSGEITGKFLGSEFTIPKREDLAGVDLEDLSLSMLSEAISDYFREGSDTKAGERMQQGFKAVRQLKAWLDLYRDSDPNRCAECTQQM